MQESPRKVRVMNMKMKNTPLRGRGETKIKMPNQSKTYKKNRPKVYIKTFGWPMTQYYTTSMPYLSRIR